MVSKVKIVGGVVGQGDTVWQEINHYKGAKDQKSVLCFHGCSFLLVVFVGEIPWNFMLLRQHGKCRVVDTLSPTAAAIALQLNM